MLIHMMIHILIKFWMSANKKGEIVELKLLSHWKAKHYKIFEYNDIKNLKVFEISKYFKKENIDIIMILNNKKPYYLITSKDIIEVLLMHMDEMTVKELIDKYPKKFITLKENESIFDAYKLMRTYNINYIIVVDEEGKFKNIINYDYLATFLAEMAIKDEITGLYNRRFFEFLIEKYENSDYDIGILFIDLDNFKNINDTYGHNIGDEILRKVGFTIKSSIRDLDYGFRYGGDEFVTMLFTSKDVLKKVAQRLFEKINSIKINNIKLSASMGGAHYKSDSNSLKEVIKIADKKLYEAKKKRGELVI